MLLKQRWHNRPSGTTDTGEHIEFWVTGTQADERQAVLKKMYRARKPWEKSVELIPDDEGINVFLTCEKYWSEAQLIGFVPKSIEAEVRASLGKLKEIEVAEFGNDAFGKGIYCCRLRAPYGDGQATPREAGEPDLGDPEIGEEDAGDTQASDRVEEVPRWHIPVDSWVPGKGIELKMEELPEVSEDDFEEQEIEEECQPSGFNATMRQLSTWEL